MIAAKGGPSLVQALCSGNALSGLLVATLRCAVHVLTPGSAQPTGGRFFALVQALVLVAFVAWTSLRFSLADGTLGPGAGPGVWPLLGTAALRAQNKSARASAARAWPCMAAVCLGFALTLS